MPDPILRPERLKRLLTQLIDIYSPSGKEADVVAFLAQYLKRAGFEVVRQTVDEDRDNLLVFPRHRDPELVLVGHVDTVPAYDFETYESDEDGDEIYGLGATDMKGGVAAMIEALRACQECDRAPAVALALVVGEEESGDGSQELLREYHFPWALVGEPTDLRPCLSHHSYLELYLQTTGKRMHASMAKQGRNAILRMLQELTGVLQHLDAKRPDVAYNVRDLSSSHKGFAVPDACECWLDLHAPADLPTSTLRAELEDILSANAKPSRNFETKADFLTIHAGYHLPDRGAIPEALRASFAEFDVSWKPDVFPSHSDANLFWAAGVKPLILGPGRLDKAHTSDESVSFAQVLLAAKLYLGLLTRLPLDRPPETTRESPA